MKKLIPILLAVFALASCEKDPDMGKLDDNYLVYTNYDKQANFKDFSTFYLADLGIQVSYIASTYYFTGYTQPEWWWGYPGYWGPSYWGNWGGWYYPYAVTYSYSTNSFITEMVNLKADEGEGKKLPVIWTSYLTGFETGSKAINRTLAIEAVNQSFTQSPYLTNK